jgi:hypothetical protein
LIQLRRELLSLPAFIFLCPGQAPGFLPFLFCCQGELPRQLLSLFPLGLSFGEAFGFQALLLGLLGEELGLFPLGLSIGKAFGF